MIEITDHAFQRGRERLALNKKALQRHADKAFNKGIKLEDTKGDLHLYLEKKYKQGNKCNNMRIYGEILFLFSDNRLVTITTLPTKYKAIL